LSRATFLLNIDSFKVSDHSETTPPPS